MSFNALLRRGSSLKFGRPYSTASGKPDNLYSLVEASVSSNPWKDALLFKRKEGSGYHWDYQTLHWQLDGLAEGLKQARLTPNNVFACNEPTGPPHVMAFLATGVLGMQFSPVSTKKRMNDLKADLLKVQPQGILFPSTFHEDFHEIIPESKNMYIDQFYRSVDFPKLRTTLSSGGVPHKAFIPLNAILCPETPFAKKTFDAAKSRPSSHILLTIPASDEHVYNFSHGSVVSSSHAARDFLKLKPEDRMLIALPFTLSPSTYAATVLSTLSAGACLVLPEDAGDACGVLERAQTTCASVLAVDAATWESVCAHAANFNLEKLETVLVVSTPQVQLSKPIQLPASMSHCKVLRAFATEQSAGLLFHTSADASPATLGNPFPGVEVKSDSSGLLLKGAMLPAEAADWLPSRVRATKSEAGYTMA